MILLKQNDVLFCLKSCDLVLTQLLKTEQLLFLFLKNAVILSLKKKLSVKVLKVYTRAVAYKFYAQSNAIYNGKLFITICKNSNISTFKSVFSWFIHFST